MPTRSMFRALLAVAVLAVGVLSARPLHAQFALDDGLRKAIQQYQAGRYEVAIPELQRLAASGRLTTADRAVAEMYRGFALIRIRRDVDGARALERAVAIDPTLRPDPVAHAAELIEAWRRARLGIPLLTQFDVAPREFLPGVDSAARVNYTIETSSAERRFVAQIRLLLVPGGTTDTIVAWRGDENQVIRWDGLARGQPLTAGLWDFVLEARAPGSETVALLRRRAEVEVLASSGVALIPNPPRPRFLPETVTFTRVDEARKRDRLMKGFWIGAIGGALTAYSFANAQSAIDETAKGSSQRYVVATAYTAGVIGIAWGGYNLLAGWFGNYTTPVAFPSQENIRRNRDMRLAYQADSARVEERNRAISTGRLVRLRFVEDVR
jgi:hypothetical protein